MNENMNDQTMRDYYAQRANTLEQVYQKPERQQDLKEIELRLLGLLKSQSILELACGTGYWSERLATVATSIYATDINPSLLDIAQKKNYPENKVSFGQADIFDLPASIAGKYPVCFAGFLWSHILREQQTALLNQWRKKIGAGTLLVLIDNNYVEGSSTPVARTDMEGNTWQLRDREDGSRVEIVKNFPSDSALRKKFASEVRDIRIFRNTHYWMLSCVLK
jgi:SAM-dependent methyltransferase